MGAKRLSTCCVCGRKFKPEPRSEDRQKWCSRVECRAERDRARKRRYYRRRKEREAAFRERERVRCRDAMRALRARRREEATEPCAPPEETDPPMPLEHVMLGVVSQLSDSTDPVALRVLIGSYADRGRRLSVPHATARSG